MIADEFRYAINGRLDTSFCVYMFLSTYFLPVYFINKLDEFNIISGMMLAIVSILHLWFTAGIGGSILGQDDSIKGRLLTSTEHSDLLIDILNRKKVIENMYREIMKIDPGNDYCQSEEVRRVIFPNNY
jgi:hypothetical protein